MPEAERRDRHRGRARRGGRALDIIPFFRGELRLSRIEEPPVTELRQVMGLVAEGKLKPVIHWPSRSPKPPQRTVP